MTERDGNIPVRLDNVIIIERYVLKECGPAATIVYAIVFSFCGLSEDNRCTASIKRIAEEVGMSPRTVTEHMKILVDKRYLKDLTPKLRNHPHHYTCRSKTNLEVVIRSSSK